MAFQARDVIDAMHTGSGRPVTELRVDGGAATMDLLLRLQADLLGVPVVRAAVRETTALGAAWLAGLAEGVWGSLDELAGRWRFDAAVEPAADRTAADSSYQRWLEAVRRSMAWNQP
jgi:glycerol kinase